MGHLAHYVDVRASRLEAEVPWMIERVITAALTPLRASIDALTVRVEIYERGQGVTTEVTTLKADVYELRKDVDHLMSIDFTSLFGTVEIQDDPSVENPACDEVPPATTRDDIIVDVVAAKSEVETNEEQIEVRDAVVYEDLADLESVMFEPGRPP
ncbi:uncharacterized protein LOC125837658 [Solanum verrucosum]|uniref:uncharacterized protein LOC125837658 n=1 Tax=Solanum verrucosum TaxID=315347 RepID=UPI0020D0A996|nr:uncharacterized protein LOC125837658 [Solanum verrucosum]